MGQNVPYFNLNKFPPHRTNTESNKFFMANQQIDRSISRIKRDCKDKPASFCKSIQSEVMVEKLVFSIIFSIG